MLDTRIVILIILVFCVCACVNSWFGETKTTKNTDIQIMIRQAARWATAARQDDNAMIAVLHANYGAGYLWALKDIATNAEIEDATSIDMKRFTYEIVKTQDDATKKMAKLCPKYAPSPSYLTKIGG